MLWFFSSFFVEYSHRDCLPLPRHCLFDLRVTRLQSSKEILACRQSYLAWVVTVACFASFFVEGVPLSIWTPLSTCHRRTASVGAQRSCVYNNAVISAGVPCSLPKRTQPHPIIHLYLSIWVFILKARSTSTCNTDTRLKSVTHRNQTTDR